MKRRDFLKLGAKAAVLPVVLPALAKEPQSYYGRPHEQTWRPIENLEISSDPFEDIATMNFKAWQQGSVSPINENLMKKLGENAAKTINQIEHDLNTDVFS